MYCPKCGNPEQVAETYCRKCGVFLYDASKPAIVTRPPVENNVPTFVRAFRPAVCFVSAILLYAIAGTQPGASSVIPITAIILFAMGIVQAEALRKTISRRKRFDKQELAAHNAEIADKLLVPPNFADIVPESVTDHTTRKLAENRRRE
jgi:hypothetical protein